MNEVQRQETLLDYLSSNQFISTSEYVDMLNISLSTARRDITKLAGEGRLIKLRNGARSSDDKNTFESHTPTTFIPLITDIENYSAKKRIAQAAAGLCDEQDSIVVSGSNTTFLMSEFLANRDIQVITNFMPLAYQLIQQGHQNIIILGGQYIGERQITISPDKEAADDLKSRFVFFTGTGISNAGVHTSDLLVYMAERKLLQYGDRLVAVAEGSKIGKHGGKLLVPTEQLDTLITDSSADPDVLNALKEKGVKIIITQ
ncbi:transcriptional regulator [Vibrio sp. MACH09]|uniref:HTH-type transcriptional regulator UlaR n=1 Tax=Vibrio sp. MACH09 TaxID=3025122 RepID=UPI00278E02FD|nr:HTH-type transcriptional regulator UlaR [Vibrio sp. MACH09]GLO62879.1 transcriptional regulator [Vibrio sp. MACH09]